MLTIELMRKLGKAKQISYRSTPEIVARLDLAAAKLAVDLEFDGAKLRTGHLVNAIALWMAKLPEEELKRFAEPKLRELEVFLGREGESDGPREDAGNPNAAAHSRRPLRHLSTTIVPIEITVDDDEEDEPDDAAKGRKRRGVKKGRES